jgi:hypothetical protein
MMHGPMNVKNKMSGLISYSVTKIVILLICKYSNRALNTQSFD